jgi:hypothetical protein
MNNELPARTGQRSDPLAEIFDRMERYCTDHPRSPSAVRRPQLSRRGRTFVALLGRNLQSGIVGIGNTVEAALRAFDLQYLRALQPPPRKAKH